MSLRWQLKLATDDPVEDKVMTMLYGGHDRAKASEHAIFILRELHVPRAKVAQALPRAVDRLAGTLSLVMPGISPESERLPLDAVLSPSRDTSDLGVTLRLPSCEGAPTFFDGFIRIEGLSGPKSNLVLIGRFTTPKELLYGTADVNTMRDIAEDNLLRIFEEIILMAEQLIVSEGAGSPVHAK